MPFVPTVGTQAYSEAMLVKSKVLAEADAVKKKDQSWLSDSNSLKGEVRVEDQKTKVIFGPRRTAACSFDPTTGNVSFLDSTIVDDYVSHYGFGRASIHDGYRLTEKDGQRIYEWSHHGSAIMGARYAHEDWTATLVEDLKTGAIVSYSCEPWSS
jgi:hypothetical protein